MGTSMSSPNGKETMTNTSLFNTSNSMIATTDVLSNGTSSNTPNAATNVTFETTSQIYDRDPVSGHQNVSIGQSRQSTIGIENPHSFNNASSKQDNLDNFELNLFGTHIHPFRWFTLTTLYSWLGPLSSLAMIIGCVIPYVPQYIAIYKTKNCSGFSTFVCLTLLMANILRIAFWFGHPFELPLLVQSVLMILAQLLLLDLCVRVKHSPPRSLFKSSPRYFWRWTDIFSYLEFLCFITALIGTAMFFLIDCKPFVESIGYLALVIESMLGLPQVVKNYRKKSVEGMSLSMVLMWLGGDLFKTHYYIENKVPLQFWLCGLLQITIDLLILFQVFIFRQNAPLKVNSQVEDSPKELMQINVND